MTDLITRLRRTEDPAARHLLLRTRALMHYLPRGHVVRRRMVERYLAGVDQPRLHIGAGPMAMEGWLNTDLISGEVYLDLTRRLPFADRSFAYAFGEHVIEHITEEQGQSLLTELRRVLRPDGVLRLTTPDLRKIISIYFDENPVIELEDYRTFLDAETGKRHDRACQVLNDYLRLWGHQYVYDEEDLQAKLVEAGFTSVERLEPGRSSHPLLRDLERHGGEEWVNQAEAMCIEASGATRT